MFAPRPVRWIFLVVILLASITRISAAPKEPALPETGVNVVREKGGWLNIEALENRLTLRFFDAEKQPQAPDVERGSARVVSPSRDDHRVVLSRDRDSLRSPAKIRPPWVFRIHLVLYREGDSAEESFVIHYPDRKKQ